jgi:hypothetical protein
VIGHRLASTGCHYNNVLDLVTGTPGLTAILSESAIHSRVRKSSIRRGRTTMSLLITWSILSISLIVASIILLSSLSHGPRHQSFTLIQIVR